MRRNWTTAPKGRAKRINWIISFVIPMVLLALLLAVKPAGATTSGRGPEGRPLVSATVLEVAEPDEEEAAETGQAGEECAEGETEAEEPEEELEGEEAEETEVEEEPESEGEEEAEACAGKHRKGPPSTCLLRTARARLFAYASHDRVRLVIRYTTFAPASVAVDYSFDGGRRPQTLGAATRRFTASGLFRVTEKLSRREMAKVLAAKGFTVKMDIAAAPKYCHRFYTRHLTVRRDVHGQSVWYQSDSAFGTPRK